MCVTPPEAAGTPVAALAVDPQSGASAVRVSACEESTAITASTALDGAHFLSAGIVSFARGLNDTPKIVALLVGAGALGIHGSMAAVALGIAVGGLLSARRVAQTISHRITPMNQGQGFTANIVTGALVVFATRLGMPVSTTHVSVGSLFGIGASTGQANRRMVSEILLAWERSSGDRLFPSQIR